MKKIAETINERTTTMKSLQQTSNTGSSNSQRNGGPLELTTICPRCGGSGWLVHDSEDVRDPNFGKLIACECLRQKRAQTLDSRLPAALRDCTLSTFGVDWQRDAKKRQQLIRAKAQVAAYAQDPTGWLYLHGFGGEGCGTGKSHLAAAVAHELTARGWLVLFKRLPDLLQDATGDYEARAERLQRLRTVDVLVVDDMGKEYTASQRAQEYRNSVMFDVLDARYGEGLPTLMTSNYHPDQLQRQRGYNPAIISRIWGLSMMVILDGEDYRRRES